MTSVSRRQLLKSTGAAIVATTTNPATWTAAQTTTTNQPNIVFILVDDLDSALFNEALDSLPSIKRIASEGASFSRFLASTPLCSPSRASMLRGQYAHNHGVLWNRNQPGGDGGFEAFHRNDREQSTIATWLQDAGYRTALVGKYLNGYPGGAELDYVPPGWDRWAVHSSAARELFYFDYQLNQDGVVTSFGDRERDYSTDVVARIAREFIEDAAAREQPMFLMAAPYAPHDPATPAPRHANAPVGELVEAPSFDEADVSDKPEWVQANKPLSSQQERLLRTGYQEHWRSLLAVDDLLETVISSLEATGILENTYIVFASDNGFHFGEHRIPFGKATPYDESARVPLLVRGPGVGPGVTIDDLAMTIDLAPSFAGWAGISPPDFVDGRSLAPILSGEATDGWRNVGLIEQFEDISVRTTRSGATNQTRIENEDGRLTTRLLQTPLPRFAGIRASEMLYVEYETGEREFYDLASDPFALTNLELQLAPDQLASLHETVVALASCAGERCRTADIAPMAVKGVTPGNVGTPVAGSA